MLSPGGADKNVVVFDRREEQIVATLKGHTKKVSSVIYHPGQVGHRSRASFINSFVVCLQFSHVSSHVLSVGGVLSVSRQHYPCVVGQRGQLCAGDQGPRGQCYRPLSARYRRLLTELIWGPGNTGWCLRNWGCNDIIKTVSSIEVTWRYETGKK